MLRFQIVHTFLLINTSLLITIITSADACVYVFSYLYRHDNGFTKRGKGQSLRLHNVQGPGFPAMPLLIILAFEPKVSLCEDKPLTLLPPRRN